MDVIGARATESARIGGLRLKCLSHTLVLDRWNASDCSQSRLFINIGTSAIDSLCGFYS
jgi:hypothetical protein